MPDVWGMIKWFGRREALVKDLRLFNAAAYRYVAVDAHRSPKLPASLLSALLTSQAASILTMNLDMGAVMLSTIDIAVLASIANGLKEVVLCLNPLEITKCWDDHGAAVIKILSRLPALELLTLSSVNHVSQLELPTARELSTFHSASLTQMRWDLTRTDENSLILGNLPSLRSCALHWTGRIEVFELHVTPTSFRTAASLTQLMLHGSKLLCLAPGAFDCLSMLSELHLRDCGLVKVPALAGVQQTLQHLDLYDNAKLQIDQTGFATLMSLQVLKHVDVQKTYRIIQDPALLRTWSIASVQHISRFLLEWCRLHPGAIPPTLAV